MKRLVFSIIILQLSAIHLIFGQQDRNFWFAAPAVTKNHCSGAPGCNNGDAPVKFVITTFDLASTVTISQPANDISLYPVTGFTPIVLNIPKNSTREIVLWTDNFNIVPAENQMRKNVECRPAYGSEATPLNKGINIKATTDIAVYYIVDEPYNSEIFALKGKNALGTDFYANFQTNKSNHYFNPAVYEPFISSIDIVAVDPGITEVVVYPTKPIEGWGAVLPPDSFVVNLQYGQTISLMPKDYWKPSPTSQPSVLPANHLTGTRIKTRNGKRIAVTLKDDSVDGDSGCWDLLGDQTIPVEAVRDDGTRKQVIGADYVVMKGNLGAGNNDRAYILATKNGTNVSVTDITLGGPPTNFALNAGQQATYKLAATTKVVYIKSNDPNKPVYVFHVSGAGAGCELGSAILPTISSCTGSFEVGFFRNNELPAAKQFLLNILARDGALDSFLLNNDASIRAVINSTGFTKIPGTPWWAGQFNLTNIIPRNAPYILKNTKDIFHLGIMHGGSGDGGNYGYFSNYAEVEANTYVAETGDPGAKICYGETIQVVASGGSSYEWIPSTYLSDPFSDKPFCTPFSSIKYQVVVKGASCAVPDTAEVPVIVADSLAARFDVDITQGCAPLTVKFTDRSYGGTKYYWYQDGSLISSIKNIPPRIFYNKTNAAIDYEIEEEVDNAYCLKVYSRIIRVYPEINAGFKQDTILGCQPLNIQFTDTSNGNIDTTQYLWEFGDFSQSFDRNPSHTYTNKGIIDSIFTVRLITTSPFFCNDTATSIVKVHPRIETALTVDKSFGCSPLTVELNPGNSIGVDTFKWHVNYVYSDSSYITTSYLPIQLIHHDTSYTNGPDTLSIKLSTINRMGCTDTFSERKIVVYPEVTADFSIDKDFVCDSVPVTFTNNSTGYKLFYDWDFDDGTIFQDTLKSVYEKPFFNRSDYDSIYIIRLKAKSEYFCESIFSDSILVHPFIKANFGIDYQTNCAPMLTNFSNFSVRADTNKWDFGDGSLVINDSSKFDRVFNNYSSNNDTTYFIKLVTLNNQGCSDTLVRSLQLYPQVVALFHLHDSTGCSPLSVDFQNASKGGLLSYLWEFGDGTSSTASDTGFTRSYSNLTQNDTIYNVNLSVSNPFGCNSKDSSQVSVLASIKSNFNLPTIDSCSPFTIRPANLSSSGAKFFNWNFGPLGISTLKNPVVAPYINPGTDPDIDTVNVRLIAFGANDSLHLACSDTHTIRILIYPELNLNFALDTVAACQPLKANITNSTLLKPVTTFQWRLDDNFYSSLKDPLPLNVSNYTNSNVTHKLKLLGTSNHGCSDIDSIPFTVYSLVESRFTINQPAVCSHDSVIINRTTSRGGITGYLWDYGDGTSTRSDSIYFKKFTNPLGAPENRQIKLTVNNLQNCKSVWTQPLQVNPKVTAAFIFKDNADKVCYPFNSDLINTTSNASNYYWEFGDGSGSGDINPKHSFENFSNTTDKTYTVKLKARSDYFCFDSTTHNITIYAKPNANFIFDPVSIDCPPFEANMINQSTGSNLTNKWYYANLDSSNLINPSYTFYNNGSSILTRNIRLIVKSDKNCYDTLNQTLSVYPEPSVEFTPQNIMGCSPLNVDFTGSSSNVSQFYWYIDGNPFSTLIDPSYRFVNETNTTKVFNIEFKATSIYNCNASINHPVTVYASPTVEFIPDPILQDYNTGNDITPVTFFNETLFQDSWSYQWTYGDGMTDNQTGSEVVHNYGNMFWGDNNNHNKVPVSLVGWNTADEECRDTVTHDIIIKPPLPEIDIAEDIAACVPFTVNFSATTKYIYDGSYQWDFGVPGDTSDLAEPTYTYTDPGVYTAKLVVRGEGGTNWDYKIISVYPKPEVAFTFNDSVAFVTSQNRPDEYINFYNQTMLGSLYEWYFENNLESGVPDDTEKDPSHHYTKIGTYYVALVSKSSESCSDTLISSTAIRILGEASIEFPTAFFVDPESARDEYVSNPEDPDKYIFRPYAHGVEEYKLEIYNRWGVLIFESKDVNKGWNGYLDGKPAKQDVYLWRVTGRFTNGEPIHESGDVTLLIKPVGKEP
jgi:PKD repeat protein